MVCKTAVEEVRGCTKKVRRLWNGRVGLEEMWTIISSKRNRTGSSVTAKASDLLFRRLFACFSFTRRLAFDIISGLIMKK